MVQHTGWMRAKSCQTTQGHDDRLGKVTLRCFYTPLQLQPCYVKSSHKEWAGQKGVFTRSPQLLLSRLSRYANEAMIGGAQLFILAITRSTYAPFNILAAKMFENGNCSFYFKIKRAVCHRDHFPLLLPERLQVHLR